MDSLKQQKHSELTPDKTNYFRNKLLEKEQFLINGIEERRKEALGENVKDATGNLSDYPLHLADIGTDEYNREFELILMRRNQQELEEVREALNRIDEGRYGICEGTGEEIPLRRLEVMPEARVNVSVRERDELLDRAPTPFQPQQI